jgi:hypothetical protein
VKKDYSNRMLSKRKLERELEGSVTTFERRQIDKLSHGMTVESGIIHLM